MKEMKEVNGIQILEDIELEGIVGGAAKKTVPLSLGAIKVAKKAMTKKTTDPGPHVGGPELI